MGYIWATVMWKFDYSCGYSCWGCAYGGKVRRVREGDV